MLPSTSPGRGTDGTHRQGAGGGSEMTVLFLLAALGTSASIGPDRTGADLDGLWHAMPFVGSGYARFYAFFPDGSFVWRENGMDGEARLRERRGSWIASGDTLLFLVESEIRWEGGTLEPATGSTGTDSELVGFTTSVIDYPFPDTLRIPFAGPLLEMAADNPDLPVDMWRIIIGGDPFWRLCGDPEVVREILIRGY